MTCAEKLKGCDGLKITLEGFSFQLLTAVSLNL